MSTWKMFVSFPLRNVVLDSSLRVWCALQKNRRQAKWTYVAWHSRRRERPRKIYGPPYSWGRNKIRQKIRGDHLEKARSTRFACIDWAQHKAVRAFLICPAAPAPAFCIISSFRSVLFTVLTYDLWPHYFHPS